MLCSCGIPMSSDRSNHAAHLKTKKHLRGGKVLYTCVQCCITFTDKTKFSDHCASALHKAKRWGKLSYNEIGDIDSIVRENETNHRGLQCMKRKVLIHYFKRRAAFMVSLKSDIVHVFDDAWREISLQDFMYKIDFLANEAIEMSGLSPKYLDAILEDGQTADGQASKAHTYWCKEQLVQNFNKMV